MTIPASVGVRRFRERADVEVRARAIRRDTHYYR